MQEQQTSKHPTKAERSARVSAVEQMLLEGYSFSEIVGYCRLTFQVGRKATEKYIQAATKRIEKVADSTREFEVAKARRRYERLHRKALKAGDLREARACQTALDKLLGLQAPQKLEHTGANGSELSVMVYVPDNGRGSN